MTLKRINKFYRGCGSNVRREVLNSCSENYAPANENYTECKDGFFGPGCCRKCPVNCLKCASVDKCLSCKYGWSGNVCQINCSQNCVRYNSSISHQFQYIRLALVENAWCLEDGTCTNGCIAGKYGANCAEDCPNKDHCLACSQFTGHCIKCLNGMYGKSQCDKRCGHCKTVIEGKVECNIQTGECSHGCIDGYYSSKCDKKCGQCMSNPIKCNLTTGFCENGCVNGYFGRRCDKVCGHCQPNPNGTVKCNKETGKCNNCNSSYYGQGCYHKCKQSCFDSINNQVRCDKSSGNCTFGCIRGFYGDNCEKLCNNTCKDKLCRMKDGYCEKGCASGWYGDFCNERCNINCYNSTCTQNLGYCKVGCKPGWYGHNCNEICSTNCRNTSCTQRNGYCDNGCILGIYGNVCNNVCSLTCSNKSCDQITGNCDKGCVDEWFGIRCENKCSSSCINMSCDLLSGHCNNGCIPNYYGNMCELRCLGNCKGNVCDRHLASCTLGCIPGYRGTFCNETIEVNCSNQFVIGFTGSLIGIVTAFLLFIVRWLLKSLILTRHRYGELDMSTRENVLPIYEEIEDNFGISGERDIEASHSYMEVAPLPRITQISDTSTLCSYEVPVRRIDKTSIDKDFTMIENREDDTIMTDEDLKLESHNSVEDHQLYISETSRKYYEIPYISKNPLRGFKLRGKPLRGFKLRGKPDHHIYDYPSSSKNTCGVCQGIKAISVEQLENICHMSNPESDIYMERRRPHSDPVRKSRGAKHRVTKPRNEDIIKVDSYNVKLFSVNPKDKNESHVYYANMNKESNINIKCVLSVNSSFGQPLFKRASHRFDTTIPGMEEAEETSQVNSYVNRKSFQTNQTKEIKIHDDNESVHYLHPIN